MNKKLEITIKEVPLEDELDDDFEEDDENIKIDSMISDLANALYNSKLKKDDDSSKTFHISIDKK